MTIHFLTVTHIHMTPTQADIERSRQGDLTKKRKHGRRHHNKDKGIIILM